MRVGNGEKILRLRDTYGRGDGVTPACLSGAAHAALRLDGAPHYALVVARRHGFRGYEHKPT